MKPLMWWIVTGVIGAVLIALWNIGMDRAIDSISTPGDSIPILDYAIEGLMWLVQAWLALLAAALINGFTGNGFRVRITSPGE